MVKISDICEKWYNKNDICDNLSLIFEERPVRFSLNIELFKLFYLITRNSDIFLKFDE